MAPPHARVGVVAALVLLSIVLAPAASAAARSPVVPAPVSAVAPSVGTDELVLDVAPAVSPLAVLAHDHVDDHGRITADPGPRQMAAGRDLEPFVAIGFSWSGTPGGIAHVTITHADGEVVGPVELADEAEHGEDLPSSRARRVTEPVALTKPAVAFEVSVPGDVRDVRANLVRDRAGAPTASRTIDAPVQQATADGIPGPEGIRTRESWGARPRKQTDSCAANAAFEGLGCVGAEGVVNAVVHHTVNANNYSAASVPALLRSIQAYHQDAQAFDDIGYNFVVDRFGTIWEARAGGADRPVVGGHTAGFNTGSVGVAVLGTFDGAAPSEAAIDAVARIIAWKLAPRNVDPNGTVTVISNGGDRHPAGVPVTVNTIDGHRSLGATGCPGAALFARLGDIRARAAAYLPLVTGELTGLDRIGNQMRLTGFALRRDTAAPMAITVAVDGQFAGQAVANVPRGDVAARFGAIGGAHGFDVTLPVTSATQQVCVTENLSGTLIGCREVNPVTPPLGDFGFTTALDPPRINLGGWVIDPDSSASASVHVYLDGAMVANLTGNQSRPDVAAVYPTFGPNRGFSTTLATSPGAHQLCVYAINTPAGNHRLIACKEAVVGAAAPSGPTVPNDHRPTGWLDAVAGVGGAVEVHGWAFDRDSTVAPLNVHVYVGPALSGIVAGNPRPDVAAVISGAPAGTGFAARIAAAPGTHNVCVYAIDANLVGPHVLLGCRTVTVVVPNATPPIGALDVVAGSTGRVEAAGWAIDPDTADPIVVHVYVDDTRFVMGADMLREDVGRVYPAYGSGHGYSVHLPAARGTRRVCVYALNNLPTAVNTALGCRTVSVS